VDLGSIPHADKLLHFAMYFVLAVLVNHSARWPCLTCGLSVTAGCGAFGGLIELIQQYVGRGSSVWDATVNVAAAAVGSWAYIHWRLGKAAPKAGVD
jgi:VanZ family protein